MKSILLSILFAILLFSFASCNFGEHGVFATLIRDEDVVASKFPDGVTIVGLAQIEITSPSDTTLPYAYASYGKISRFDGSDWAAQSLPSNNMRSLSIAARHKSLFVITSSDVSTGGTLASALYVYEDRSANEDTDLWNPQWHLVKLPEDEAIYPIMDKVFVVNDRIFLVIRNTTDAKSLVSSTRVLEITDWRKTTDEPADIINRSTEPLPPIRDVSYAQGKIWFVSTGTLYSLEDTAGSTLSLETVRINTELVKGPFYGSGGLPTNEPDNPELYIAAADAIYSYNKGLWQVVKELVGAPFVDVVHVKNLSLTLIATHDEMKSARSSYAGRGLYQIDNEGVLSRPTEYDDLKNSDINTLLLLNNGNVLIGTSGGAVWEFNSQNSSIKRW